MIPITDLYKKTQDELFTFVKEFIEKNAPGAFSIEHGKNDMYIAFFPVKFQKPYPVLASHLDVKFGYPPDEVEEDTIDGITVYRGYRATEQGKVPSVLGADDRNGVWTMLKLIEDGKTQWGYIFSKEEENHRLGARALKASGLLGKYINDIAYFIQVDRRNKSDIVHYQLDELEGYPRSHNNREFVAKLNTFTGYDVKNGGLTDIIEYCTATKICGINISAGYHNEHTANEYSVIEYVNNLPGTIIKLIDHLGNKQYLIET